MLQSNQSGKGLGIAPRLVSIRQDHIVTGDLTLEVYPPHDPVDQRMPEEQTEQHSFDKAGPVIVSTEVGQFMYQDGVQLRYGQVAGEVFGHEQDAIEKTNRGRTVDTR